MSAAPGSVLTEIQLGPDRFRSLLQLAAALKRARADGTEQPRLAGRHIALVFEKNSTRTRCAFEVAAGDQGARVTFIGPDGSHMGAEESAADTARVLGRLYHGIAHRGHDQQVVETLAEHAGVPVWNALSDQWHPTQMLADVLTMTEHARSDPQGIAFCYCGDGRNNVARSLLVTGAMLGMDVRIAAPPSLQPPADVRSLAAGLADASGARVTITDDPQAGVAGADFVYTDVWLSMGESEDAWAQRVDALRPFQVTAQLLAASGKPDVRFLHCLPSLHDRRTVVGARLHDRFGLDGVEVTDEVFESAASVVFDQAENRMHTIKAVLVTALGG